MVSNLFCVILFGSNSVRFCAELTVGMNKSIKLVQPSTVRFSLVLLSTIRVNVVIFYCRCKASFTIILPYPFFLSISTKNNCWSFFPLTIHCVSIMRPQTLSLVVPLCNSDFPAFFITPLSILQYIVCVYGVSFLFTLPHKYHYSL